MQDFRHPQYPLLGRAWRWTPWSCELRATRGTCLADHVRVFLTWVACKHSKQSSGVWVLQGKDGDPTKDYISHLRNCNELEQCAMAGKIGECRPYYKHIDLLFIHNRFSCYRYGHLCHYWCRHCSYLVVWGDSTNIFTIFISHMIIPVIPLSTSLRSPLILTPTPKMTWQFPCSFHS